MRATRRHGSARPGVFSITAVQQPRVRTHDLRVFGRVRTRLSAPVDWQFRASCGSNPVPWIERKCALPSRPPAGSPRCRGMRQRLQGTRHGIERGYTCTPPLPSPQCHARSSPLELCRLWRPPQIDPSCRPLRPNNGCTGAAWGAVDQETARGAGNAEGPEHQRITKMCHSDQRIADAPVLLRHSESDCHGSCREYRHSRSSICFA